MTQAPVLRVARPTDDLDALLRFYRDGLEFHILSAFQNHSGFDGIMLGHPDATWHLEFTREEGAMAGGAPSPEHLLVLYLPDAEEWRYRVQRMQSVGFEQATAHNPYWDQRGATFVDPDGYRVVLQQADWSP